MNINEFKMNFASLINGALRDGIQPNEILPTLATAEFELHDMAMRIRMEAAQRAIASAIIPANKLPGKN